ncbi:MAG: hypothetical protein WC716_01735 [Chitinophagaceae bacterium]|jgi:hypothetical protein
MKPMKWHVIIAALALTGFTYFASSCGRCGGCDTVSTTKGATLSIYDSVVNLSNENAAPFLSIVSTVVETDGDRNCHYKDLVMCLQDGLVAEKLSVRCDKELRLKTITVPVKTITVPAGTNLLEQKEITVTPLSASYAGGLPAVNLQASSTFVPGTYTFTLAGTTKDGAAVNDIGTIIWK